MLIFLLLLKQIVYKYQFKTKLISKFNTKIKLKLNIDVIYTLFYAKD